MISGPRSSAGKSWLAWDATKVSGTGTPAARRTRNVTRSEEHTSELQSQSNLVCRLLLEKKKRARASRSEEDTSQLQSQIKLLCHLILQSIRAVSRRIGDISCQPMPDECAHCREPNRSRS